MCHFLLMFASKLLISRVTKILLFTTSVTLQIYTTYDEPLLINKDVSIHGMNVHFLVIQAFKSVNKLNSLVMWNYPNKNIFPYDLEKVYTLQFTPAHSTCHGINSVLFQGSLLWKNFLAKIKVSLLTKKIIKDGSSPSVFRCTLQVVFASVLLCSLNL